VTEDGAIPASGFAPLVPELDVLDLPRSLAFWTGPLGFRIAYQRAERGFAYLERVRASGQSVQVMLCRANGSWDTAPLEPPLGRGINLQMEVDAVSPILAALAAAPWPLFRPLEDIWYRAGAAETGCRQFLVQDPDGYLLRFTESLGTRPIEVPAA
jgi:catechol 2,3-dioxygenase-like lactoylglutathione lyase family enzyme